MSFVKVNNKSLIFGRKVSLKGTSKFFLLVHFRLPSHLTILVILGLYLLAHSEIILIQKILRTQLV